jgi:hypothetical protein
VGCLLFLQSIESSSESMDTTRIPLMIWLPLLLLMPAATDLYEAHFSLSVEIARSKSVSKIRFCSVSILFLKIYTIIRSKMYSVQKNTVLHSFSQVQLEYIGLFLFRTSANGLFTNPQSPSLLVNCKDMLRQTVNT